MRARYLWIGDYWQQAQISLFPRMSPRGCSIQQWASEMASKEVGAILRRDGRCDSFDALEICGR
jgi:hypothetical protein